MNGFRREVQRGAPLQVGDRAIVTEADVWSFQVKQMSLTDHNAAGGGALFTWARPTAVIERGAGAGAERRTPVTDINLRLEIALLIAALVLPIVLTIFTTWARRSSTPRD
jgi:hypothetical protein